MGLLKPAGSGQGHLKAGFLGFQKSGKSFTMTMLAIAVRDHFKLDGPIAYYDSESGSEYLADTVKQLTGKDLLVVRSRSFSDLVTVHQEAERDGVSVLIAESMTHVWRELCDAYLQQVNEGRAKRNLKPRYGLEFQDWNPIKFKWNNEWALPYLNSKLHVIIAGRAGFEYDYEINEETNKKELVKGGVKMKTEGEFGFEPSLLVEMERITLAGEKTRFIRRATVTGDRFNVMDGDQHDFITLPSSTKDKLKKELAAVRDFFMPHLARLTPGAHVTVDGSIKTDLGIDTEGDAQWQREKRERTILCEEIQGELLRHWPGQTKEEKQAKLEAIEKAFGTRSWTRVESKISIMDLRNGLKQLKGDTANGDRYEEERQEALKAITEAMEAQKWSDEDKTDFLKERFDGKPLEQLSLDALNEIKEEVEVAF